jgi:hypothetical protein
MTDEELIAMARLAQRDERKSTGALYGHLASRIEALTAQRSEQSSLKTQDVIAWEKLPDWVEWVARDMDGCVRSWKDQPEVRSTKWMPPYPSYPPIRIDDFPGIVRIGTCDWKDSKQRRPKVRE